jgi:hypothetical protein
MDDMKLKLPKPSVDLAEIRRLYHSAAKGEAGKAKANKGKAGKPDKKG